MKHGFRFIFACLLLIPMTVMAESAHCCPCAPDPSSACTSQEYTIDTEFDLREWFYYTEIETNDPSLPEEGDPMLDSGYIRVWKNCDGQRIIEIDFHFSKTFDYAAYNEHLPDRIWIVNYDPGVVDDLDEPDRPELEVSIFPDMGDPYSFHYIGTFNWTMVGVGLLGDHIDECGQLKEDFYFRIGVY